MGQGRDSRSGVGYNLPVGSLEIQILASDRPAQEALEIDPTSGSVHEAGTAVAHVARTLAEAFPLVARFTPLMISLDHLFADRTPSALGQERFTVEVRRTVPVRVPDERLAGGPERFDIIELACGEMEFAAIVPRDTVWPHVTVHRAYPRRHDWSDFSPTLERAFFAALRDAVWQLAVPPASGSAA